MANYLGKYPNLQSSEEPLFKLAFALGLYNGHDNYKILDDFLKKVNLITLKDIFKDVEINDYNPKIIPILNTINATSNDINQYRQILISLFTNFKEIDKHIIAKKEQRIADLNIIRKKAVNKAQAKEIMLQLECLKKNKKNKTLHDFEEFIQNTIYSFKDD